MKHLRALQVLLFVLAITGTAFAQGTASLTGTVLDPTGSAVPNAKLTLINTATNATRDEVSDGQGNYHFYQLPPATYRLTVKAPGFNDVILNNVVLLVNQPLRRDLVFEQVGSVNEVVSVSAEATQVNTVDASLGTAIGNKPIIELPSNARNVVGLLALQPGVTYLGDNVASIDDSRQGAVNGGKSDQANVTLDGVDVNDQQFRTAFTSVLRVTLDSTQEFKVTTLNGSADMGRSSGAQVALVTKSGTNEIHGSAYWFTRNTITTANDFFNNRSGVERPKLIRNIYGGSVGAPIIKNRLFIFGNYEGRNDAKDGSAVRTVPSALMRQGILQFRNDTGGVTQVSAAELQARLGRPLNQNTLALLQSYPMPNDNSQGDGLNILSYRFNASTPLTWKTYIARIDWMIDKANKHSVFARGNLQNDNQQALPQFPGDPPNSVGLNNSKGYATGWTAVWKPNLITNTRFGFTRQGYEDTGIANYSAVSLRNITDRYGLTRGNRAFVPVYTLAEDVSWVAGKHTVQFGGVFRYTSQQRDNLSNSFNSASVNASWLVDSGNELNAPFPTMSSTYRVAFRDAAAAVLGLVSQGNAQYNYTVQGEVIPTGSPVSRNFVAREYEMYVMDTWKIRRNLTVTLGLRYSLAPPIFEANGQQLSTNIPIGDWFNARGGLAQQGKSTLGAGTISYIPSDGPGGRPLYPFHKKNFAPRASIAWQPDAKTVVRVGWGMYYDTFGSGIMRSFDSLSFGLSSTITNPSAVQSVGTAPAYTSYNQVPSSLLLPGPKPGYPAVYPNLFAITGGLDDTLVPPYSMNQNFSVGRELGKGWYVEGSYAGRFSRRSLVRSDAATPTNLVDVKSGQDFFSAAKILAGYAIKGTPAAEVPNVPFFQNLWSTAATSTLTATQSVYRRYLANAPDWTYALYQFDTDDTQGGCQRRGLCGVLGPNAMFDPQFSYLSVWRSIAGGNYNAAQVLVQKRWSNGDTLNFNYTFSKSQDLRSSTERTGTATGVIFNPWSPNQFRSVSDYDQTHNLSGFGVYNLPFGRGQKFGSGANGFVNALIGGWQISGVVRWSSGLPISVGEGRFWPTNWNLTGWATQIAPAETTTTKNAKYVEGGSGPNLFANPTASVKAWDYTMPGESGQRNGVRGDGVFTIDTNIAKTFRMPWSESQSLQFRWETFNLTNTVRFDVNSLTLDLGNVGAFGNYSGTLVAPRVMQFGLRYQF